MKDKNRQQLLEEAIEIVRHADITLGDEIPEEEVDPLKNKAVALLQSLKKEQVEFSPKLSVYPLNREDYPPDARQLLTEIEQRMREHIFYRVARYEARNNPDGS